MSYGLVYMAMHGMVQVARLAIVFAWYLMVLLYGCELNFMV